MLFYNHLIIKYKFNFPYLKKSVLYLVLKFFFFSLGYNKKDSESFMKVQNRPGGGVPNRPCSGGAEAGGSL